MFCCLERVSTIVVFGWFSYFLSTFGGLFSLLWDVKWAFPDDLVAIWLKGSGLVDFLLLASLVPLEGRGSSVGPLFSY